MRFNPSSQSLHDSALTPNRGDFYHAPHPLILWKTPFSGALRRTNQNKRAAGSATTNAMEESMSNVAAVQSLGASKQEQRRFAKRSAETFQRERYAMAGLELELRNG
jgi:ABC-type multidrug transport system fused ATPase/permease subunit